MRFSSIASYFFAGILLTNGVPHHIQGLTGRRNITPFGRDSSPLVNLLWGFCNFVGGYLLIRYADRKAGTEANSDAWQLPCEAGSLFWSLFGVLYSLYAAASKKAAQDKRRLRHLISL